MHLQVTVAILIVLNFVCNAYEAQMNGFLTNADGSPTSDAQFLEKVDVAFTVVFTFELACNLFAHLFWEFVSNGWCMFDFIVVSIRYVRVSRSLLIHSRSLLVYSRSLLVYSRSLLICSRSLLVYSRSVLVYSRSVLVYSRSVLVYSRSVLIYSRSQPFLTHTSSPFCRGRRAP